MAAIGKIREKSGLLLVIIGLALAAFVFGGLIKNLGKSKRIDQSRVALVNDEKVATQDFSERVSEQADILKRQQKKSSLSPEETYQNVMNVWDLMKRETLMRQQMVEIGLLQQVGNSPKPQVSMDEYMDNLIGAHPNKEIIRNFSDPKTGKFNPQAVSNFLNYLEQTVNSKDPKQRSQALQSQNQWNMLKKYIKEEIPVQKYYDLLTESYYLPKALAKMEFADNNQMRKIAYFGARYNLVPDADAKPTEADYEKYYRTHKYEFKNKKETRKIQFITWDVRPSKADVIDLQKEIQQYAKDLKTVDGQDITYMVNRIGDNRYDSSWVKKGSLSPFIDSAAFASSVGTVLGPWTANGAYHVAKVVARSLRPDSMEASHILITYSGAYGAGQGVTRTKVSARALADSILKVVKANPAKFNKLVAKSDDDATKVNDGSLGWFANGTMIPAINNACVNGKKGQIELVETPFGFHILRIDNKSKLEPMLRVAQINLPITFSQETFNKVYGKAIKFAAVNQSYASFDTSSANQGLNVQKSNFVNELSKGITGLKNSRDVVKWMFNDKTKVGTVSSVFDFENKVMVAVLTDIRPEGYLTLDEVKDNIRVLVVRDVKARILEKKLKNVSSLSDAAKYKSTIDTATLAFASYSLPNYGPEQNVQGRMAVAKKDALTGPVKGDQAVFFFKVLNIGKLPAKEDIKYIQQRNTSLFKQRVGSAAYRAIEDKAVIENFLYYFY